MNLDIDKHASESINHLCLLHTYLNSGLILEAAKDWLAGEIASMEIDLGLLPLEVMPA